MVHHIPKDRPQNPFVSNNHRLTLANFEDKSPKHGIYTYSKLAGFFAWIIQRAELMIDDKTTEWTFVSKGSLEGWKKSNPHFPCTSFKDFLQKAIARVSAPAAPIVVPQQPHVSKPPVTTSQPTPVTSVKPPLVSEEPVRKIETLGVVDMIRSNVYYPVSLKAPFIKTKADIETMNSINGLSIAEIEERARPNQTSTEAYHALSGFLGANESFKDVLRRDWERVEKMGMTHEKLVNHFIKILSLAKLQQNELKTIEYSISGEKPQKLNVVYRETRGDQEDLFTPKPGTTKEVITPDVWRDEIIIENPAQGIKLTLNTGVLNYILQFGFYEGGGDQNKYRVDPAKAMQLLTGKTFVSPPPAEKRATPTHVTPKHVTRDKLVAEFDRVKKMSANETALNEEQSSLAFKSKHSFRIFFEQNLITFDNNKNLTLARLQPYAVVPVDNLAPSLLDAMYELANALEPYDRPKITQGLANLKKAIEETKSFAGIASLYETTQGDVTTADVEKVVKEIKDHPKLKGIYRVQFGNCEIDARTKSLVISNLLFIKWPTFVQMTEGTDGIHMSDITSPYGRTSRPVKDIKPTERKALYEFLKTVKESLNDAEPAFNTKVPVAMNHLQDVVRTAKTSS